ncbi:DNA-binding protein HU-beta [Streptomyces sp. MJP52]|nr:DNA-binding protein HU-beta [Streptomyces sp. MJP52]
MPLWARGSDHGPGCGGLSGDPGSIGFAVPDMRLRRVARLNGKKKHGSKNMNRSELVAALADRAEVTRKDADAVLAAFAEVVGDIVSKGDEKVTIPGFLTFERTHRAARTARNPQTGEPIQIPAGYSVKVSAGSKLKEAAKGK